MDVRSPFRPLASIPEPQLTITQSVSTYSVASLAWLASQAVPLIIWPSLVTTLLRVDGAAQGPQYGVAHVSLEQYFARSLGLSQLALGSLLLVLSGTLPLDSMADGTAHPPIAPPPSSFLPLQLPRLAGCSDPLSFPTQPPAPTTRPPRPPTRAPPSSSRRSTTPRQRRTRTRATTRRAASWATCLGAWARASWPCSGCGCSCLRGPATGG